MIPLLAPSPFFTETLKPCKCPLCGKCYRNPSARLCHLSSAHFNREILEEYEKTVLPEDENLLDRGKPGFSCKDCGISFVARFALVQHLGARHEMVFRFLPESAKQELGKMKASKYTGRIQCLLCPKEFTKLQPFQKHLASKHFKLEVSKVASKKTNICLFCQKSLSCNAICLIHMLACNTDFMFQYAPDYVRNHLKSLQVKKL